MTKQEFQKELQEKVKEGVKPSDIKKLKRSKSLGDIPNTPPLPTNPELMALQQENTELKKKIKEWEEKEVFVEVPEENNEELKKKITELEDKILELRLSKIKDFGTYRENLTELEGELATKIKEDTTEISKLEQRVQQLVKEKTRLSGEKSLAEWKLSKLELGETNSNWWTDYGPAISLLLVYLLSIWLLSKNTKQKYHE